MKFFTVFFLIISVNLYSQDWEKVEITSTKLTANIYMLTGSGGNIGLFTGEDASLMIDSQYGPLSEKIKKEILKLTGQKTAYLVNTHWHGDHTGGNENFSSDGAVVIAHENVRERLSTDQVMKAFSREVKAHDEGYWPTFTFEDNMNIHLNGQDVMLIHVHNAHTDGDALVYFPSENVLHMGDCFFKDRFPFIDLGSGGSVGGVLKAVETALMLCDTETKIIPGHGSLASKSDLLRYYLMIVEMHDRIKSMIGLDKSIEEIKASGLDKGYEDWGTGFINSETFIDTIWTDLADKE